MSIVYPHLTKMGWRFAGASRQEDIGYPWQMENVTQDKLYGSTHLKELYFKAQKGEIMIISAGSADDKLIRWFAQIQITRIASAVRLARPMNVKPASH
jgi:hypothetical protein